MATTAYRADQYNASLVTQINAEAIEIFRKKNIFYGFGQKRSVMPGHAGVTFHKMVPWDTDEVTKAQGPHFMDPINPNEHNTNFKELEVPTCELSFTAILARKTVRKLARRDFVSLTAKEVGIVLAERADEEVQAKLFDGQCVYYAGGRTDRSELQTGDKLTLDDFPIARRYLASKSVPTDAMGYYYAFVDPGVTEGLFTPATAGFIDVAKYNNVMAGQILKGEVGTFSGFRIFENDHINTITSQYVPSGTNTAPVDPNIEDVTQSLFMGPDEVFGIVELEGFKMNIITGASKYDPHNKLIQIPASMDFGCAILNQDGILRVESVISKSPVICIDDPIKYNF